MTGERETYAKRALQLPVHVAQVKKDLEHTDARQYSILTKLTETDDLHVATALEKMWALLEEAEIEKHGAAHFTDDYWVRSFINHIVSCTNLPDYCYQNQSQKDELLEDIEQLKSRFVKKLQAYDFDYRLSPTADRKRIVFYERQHYSDRLEIEKNGTEMPHISEMLDRVMKCIRNDVNSFKPCRDDAKKIARRFVCDIDEYLRNVYGDPVENKENYPLMPVIAIVTMAIHGVEYTESQVRKILKREDTVKQREDNWLFAHDESRAVAV